MLQIQIIVKIFHTTHPRTCYLWVERVKKKYKYLPLLTKRKGIMYHKKRKICQLIRKERKKIS